MVAQSLHHDLLERDPDRDPPRPRSHPSQCPNRGAREAPYGAAPGVTPDPEGVRGEVARRRGEDQLYGEDGDHRAALLGVRARDAAAAWRDLALCPGDEVPYQTRQSL